MSWSEGASLFFVMGGEGGLIFSSCFGVESGLSVHCSHSTWTVDSRLSMPDFLGGVGVGVQSKEFQVADSSKSSQCRPPSPMKVGQMGGSLYFEIEPSILGILYRSFFLSDGPIKLAHCQKEKERKELRRHFI